MAVSSAPKRSSVRRWIRIGFIVWAVFAMSWLANSMRTRGVEASVLQSNAQVTVRDLADVLEFVPASGAHRTALVFICGAGVTAEAYAPTLRPIAEAGFPVFIVKLPLRFAPRPSDKDAAVARARAVMSSHPGITHWVVSGHSQGGALAARMAREDASALAALVLVGTTHPKADDLSALRIPVMKIYGSNDGVAPRDRVLANRRLLPPQTQWVEIAGGNHSQFGRYGHQLGDGRASIDRDAQEALTRSAILRMLADVDAPE